MDRTAVITGGTGGLGQSVVERLLREMRCVVLYRDGKSFDALRTAVAQPERLDGVKADLTDAAATTAAIDTAAAPHNGLYALVHLLGGFSPGGIEDAPAETWREMIDLNLVGAALTLRAAVPHLRRSGDGRIVVISSEASLALPAGIGAYAVAKAALNALVTALDHEVRGSGITVNALLPTALDTPAMRKERDRSQLVPLDNVAETIAFLLSDAARNISGALIPMRAG